LGECSWLGFLSIVEDPGVELGRADVVSVPESAKRERGLADESYSESGLLGGRFRIHVDVSGVAGGAVAFQLDGLT